MCEPRDQNVAGLTRFSRFGSSAVRLDAARSAHPVDQPGNVACWIGKQRDGEIPHVRDRHYHSGAQTLGLIEVSLHVVDRSIDRDPTASRAILAPSNATVNTTVATCLDDAIVPLVVRVDLSVE